jgi:hypothetical protein
MRWFAELWLADEAAEGRRMPDAAWRIVHNEAARVRISVSPLRILSMTSACPEGWMCVIDLVA